METLDRGDGCSASIRLWLILREKLNHLRKYLVSIRECGLRQRSYESILRGLYDGTATSGPELASKVSNTNTVRPRQAQELYHKYYYTN